MCNKKWNSTRRSVERRFNKAINKNGYLSLRSIIESNYYYPRDFIIEPIRTEADVITNNYKA